MLQVEIRVKGHLDQSWSEWLDGLVFRYAEGDETVMSGPIADQAALYGLVSKLRDIGLSLQSIRLLGNCNSPAPPGEPAPDSPDQRSSPAPQHATVDEEASRQKPEAKRNNPRRPHARAHYHGPRTTMNENKEQPGSTQS
ncbi:MAG: hypothetical protein JSW55_10210 [Chloroflexota bacterium]|nr:MAG: hypothetical protein JSW55_10210 [Chloroflexota bacterium]